MSQPSIGVLIIEMNDFLNQNNPAKFYFDEIAESNNSSLGEATSLVPWTPPEYTRLFSYEVLRAVSTSADDQSVVLVRMALLRFAEPYNTDIVIHMRSEGEDLLD